MPKVFVKVAGGILLASGLLLALMSVLFFFVQLAAVFKQEIRVPGSLFLTLMYGAGGGWLISTAIGIFKQAPWARVSINIISVFSLLFGIILLFSLQFVAHQAQEKMANYSAVLGGIQTLCLIFLIILPGGYLVLFNLKWVREMFQQENGQEGEKNESGVPLGIKIIIGLYLMGILTIVTALMGSQQSVFNIGNKILSGWQAKSYFIIFNVFQLVIAAGLWRLQKWSWRACMAINIFNICLVLYNIFVTDYRTLEFFNKAMQNPQVQITLTQYRVFSAVSLVAPLAILVYLYFKRDIFKDPSGDHDQQGHPPKLL